MFDFWVPLDSPTQVFTYGQLLATAVYRKPDNYKISYTYAPESPEPKVVPHKDPMY